jgi:hypothetical protein
MLKVNWTASEEKIIIENFDKTNEELGKLLKGRSKKAITRKLEKLKEEGKIGDRSKQTIKRAYKQRRRRTKAEILADEKVQKSSVYDPDFQPIDEEDSAVSDDDAFQPADED